MLYIKFQDNATIGFAEEDVCFKFVFMNPNNPITVNNFVSLFNCTPVGYESY